MLTHEQLGIKQWEHDALVNLIEYLPTLEAIAEAWDTPTAGNGFCMYEPGQSWKCGTVACIGGWAYIISKVDKRLKRVNAYVRRHEPEYNYSADPIEVLSSPSPLSGLYYPVGVDDRWDEITPSVAVDGIKNFLNTGDPKWVELLA